MLEGLLADVEIPLKYATNVWLTRFSRGLCMPSAVFPFIPTCAVISESWIRTVLSLNYANPNPMISGDAPLRRSYGYRSRHGVQHSHEQLAEVLEVLPRGAFDYICAGINHQTWFTRLSYRGEDMLTRCCRLLRSIRFTPEPKR